MSAPTDDRPDLRRRGFVIGGALAATAAITYARMPSLRAVALPDGVLEKLVPTAIGQWRFLTISGLVLPPADQLSQEIYSQIVTRVYVRPDAPPIMLLAAYSAAQNGVLQVHRPEFCYPASGMALSDGHINPIQIRPDFTLPTRFYTAEAPTRTEQLIYWTRAGRYLPTTWLDQHLAIMKENLHRTIPDGALVRVSTISPDPDLATATMNAFVRDLFDALSPLGRRLLVGA